MPVLCASIDAPGAPRSGSPDSFTPSDTWQRAQAWVGQGVAAIDTPSLVIDLDAMERNLARMATFARERGLRLRPHAKMHKSAELSRLQMADSAEGIDRLAAALQGAGVHGAEAIDVFVEIDVGQGRCGVPPGEAALALVRRIAEHPVLRWAGLQAYHGGAQHRRSAAERADAIAGSAQAVRHTLDVLRQHGFDAPLVTGAGTGSLVNEAASGLWGELQAGSYLFMDADYATNQPDPAAPAFEHALFVKAQVMSRSADRAICDAGHKSHAIDSGLPLVTHPAGLVFANGGDEHGVLRAADPGAPLPALGDTVWLIPGHCDPTVNLHDFFVGVRGGLTQGHVERLINIDTRGALA